MAEKNAAGFQNGRKLPEVKSSLGCVSLDTRSRLLGQMVPVAVNSSQPNIAMSCHHSAAVRALGIGVSPDIRLCVISSARRGKIDNSVSLSPWVASQYP